MPQSRVVLVDQRPHHPLLLRIRTLRAPLVRRHALLLKKHTHRPSPSSRRGNKTHVYDLVLHLLLLGGLQRLLQLRRLHVADALQLRLVLLLLLLRLLQRLLQLVDLL